MLLLIFVILDNKLIIDIAQLMFSIGIILHIFLNFNVLGHCNLVIFDN